mmetsp:Transcript_11865/g.22218  ORF Transcript_11865/g.22218 Transcript_11865/m.22218 type:complete len:86 (+) Transcript_11865:2073-2330(+)
MVRNRMSTNSIASAVTEEIQKQINKFKDRCFGTQKGSYQIMDCCLKEDCSVTDDSASSHADAKSSKSSTKVICWFVTMSYISLHV